MTSCTALVLCALLAITAASTDLLDPYARAVKLVSQMNLTEKMGFIQGSSRHASGNGDYVGVVSGVPRLGIPDLRMNDGPEGFRGDPGTSTQFPSGLTVARSWDRDLFLAWGTAMGKEFYGKGANVQFGPGANLARLPNAGRSFEYLSGEDPKLGYELIQPVVTGIQSQGVVANAKHYINNNQEGLHGAGDRHVTSEIVDERTEMEMYAPPFEGAVKAGVLSIMCANNLVNGVYACENNYTTSEILRARLGFKGWICSDYDGTRSTIDAANHGLDIAMPGPPGRPDYFGAPLLAAIKSGMVSEEVIDEKVIRIVYSLAVVGALDANNNHNSSTDVTSTEHRALARKLAAESAVLLKNDKNILPLSLSSLPKRIGSIALLGDAASSKPLFGGGGSGAVTPKMAVTIYDALAEKLGMNTSKTCKTTDNNTDFFIGDGDHVTTSDYSPTGCCEACIKDSAEWAAFTVSEEEKMCWCHPSGTITKKEKQGFVSGTCVSQSPAGPLVYNDGEDVDSAVAVAKAADIAIVVISQSSREGLDRNQSIALDQSDLVSSIATVQKNTIVIAISPGPFVTPWREDVAALLDFGFPGEQEGNAVVDILFGDTNPGGKLPHTLPVTPNDMQITPRQYPGVPPPDNNTACSQKPVPSQPNGLNPSNGTGFAPCVPYKAYYDEKLLVGYRWYDAHNVTPAFEFGFGLSYTTFKYSDLTIDSSQKTVSVTVHNSGTTDGSEVVQLYLKFPEVAGEPPMQLKAFSKVSLSAGAAQVIDFNLKDRDVSIWDIDSHDWKVITGSFGVAIGSSSRDIRLTGTMTV